jgi:hypothetical protein
MIHCPESISLSVDADNENNDEQNYYTRKKRQYRGDIDVVRPRMWHLSRVLAAVSVSYYLILWFFSLSFKAVVEEYDGSRFHEESQIDPEHQIDSTIFLYD